MWILKSENSFLYLVFSQNEKVITPPYTLVGEMGRE